MKSSYTHFNKNEYVLSLNEQERAIFWKIICKPFKKVLQKDNELVDKLQQDKKVIFVWGRAITVSYYFFRQKKWDKRILKRVERLGIYETLTNLDLHWPHWKGYLDKLIRRKTVVEIANPSKKQDIPRIPHNIKKEKHVKKTPEQLRAEFLASF